MVRYQESTNETITNLAIHLILGWVDPTHCKALLNEGSWLDSNYKNWQPNGAQSMFSTVVLTLMPFLRLYVAYLLRSRSFDMPTNQ